MQIIEVLLFSGFTKLLIVGGNAMYGVIDDVEVIDFSSTTTTCDKIQNFPHYTMQGFGGLNSDNKPLVCGGVPLAKDCQILDNGSWQTNSQMNAYRFSAAICESPFKSQGHSLLVTGGITEAMTSSDSAESLNGNIWEKVEPSLKVALQGHCMVLLNSSTVMVIGGGNGQFLRETYIFNTEFGEWTDGPSLNIGRAFHSCGRIRKNSQSHEFSAIVVGGYDKSHLASVEVLDGDKWISVNDLPFGTFSGTLVEDPSGGVLHVGGEAENQPHADQIFRLAHAGNNGIIYYRRQIFSTIIFIMF